MIIYEDNEIRVEVHITRHWVAMRNGYYRCGEQFENGNGCDTLHMAPMNGVVCQRVYLKEVPKVAFICSQCAEGWHDDCVGGTHCDCQHRTVESGR